MPGSGISNAAHSITGVVINASYPRSGHRFLRELLQAYFDEELIFYESHIKKIPTRSREATDLSLVNYVKTHDFESIGVNVLSNLFPLNRKYLVQIRHPLESIASYYEFSLHHGDIKADNNAAWDRFFKEKLKYWKLFCENWVLGNRQDHIVVSYDDLYRNTSDTLSRVIHYVSESDKVDISRLEHIMERQEFLQYVGNSKSKKHGRRNIQEFTYLNSEIIESVESNLYEKYFQPSGIKPIIYSVE